MKRVYYRQDKKITVEAMSDVMAVHIGSNVRTDETAALSSFGVPATETVRDTAEVSFPDTAIDAFARANWHFVTPSEELRQASADGRAMNNSDEFGIVLRTANGSVAIATKKMIVKLKEELTESECGEILADLGLVPLMKLGFAPNLYQVNADQHPDALAASEQLQGDDRFIYAEPELVEHVPMRFKPTDTSYDKQWQWHNTGQTGGSPGADTGMENAWDLTLGANVRTAVIDNGFDVTHRDLASAISPQSGYFSSGMLNQFHAGVGGMPNGDHGTFCAGLVGARHSNGNGGCGGAPECELMLISCLNDQIGNQTTLARAVSYSADPSKENPGLSASDGADILVCSLGPNGAIWEMKSVLADAIKFAAKNGRQGRGMAIFWAASNGNNVSASLDEVVSHEDVIAVVRSDHNDLEHNAARGDTVELIAPGVNVFSTIPGGNYGTNTGTSFAAPIVASVATLVLSVNPKLTSKQLRKLLRDTADKVGGVAYDGNGHHDDYGYGRVNSYQAVLNA